VLNALGVVAFAALFALTMRRGATDPVCGMTVDRGKALSLEHRGKRHYFCGPGCRTRFEQDPDRFTGGARAPAGHAHDH
jgi:YHS domain-containing protein